MEEHRAFVEKLKKKKTGNKSSKPLTNREKMDRCKGSYIVRCEELSGNWDECDSLSIDIATGPKPGLLQAAVEFGIIEGTMLLSFNEADLDAYIGTAEESDDQGAISSNSKKRKAAAPGRGRPPKKQAKAAASLANRLFIRFRGRETGEGVVFYTPQKGYLDFTDADCVAFKAVCSMPAVGNKAPFQGFKVDSSPATRATPWESFSEAVYEEERVERWG
jgi:hypothetical protein